MATDPDAIDRMLAGWRAALPGLDPSGLELVGRVIVLAQHLERSVATALRPHGLTLGQFDILATLRRHGPKGGLAPGTLLESVMLTSGGMTGRLDKLEQAGWVVRRPDPADRRGVVVELTPKGRKLIEAAAATRFAEAERSLPAVSPADRQALAGLLRTWLAAVEAGEAE
ncbi:MAG: MarR family winged helix-turn-helix transcriptional regulator [Fimbriiglobus sp.]